MPLLPHGFFSHYCANDDHITIACYNDSIGLIIFNIKYINTPATEEGQEWLPFQDFQSYRIYLY